MNRKDRLKIGEAFEIANQMDARISNALQAGLKLAFAVRATVPAENRTLRRLAERVIMMAEEEE